MKSDINSRQIDITGADTYDIAIVNRNISREIKLTDGKITLRPYGMKDIKPSWEAIQESIKEMSPWMPFANEYFTIADERKWVKQTFKGWKNGTEYAFAITDDKGNEIIGSCGLNNFGLESLHANLGYWVRTTRTGNGTATAAVRLLAGWGFKTLGLKRIEILVATGNARSQRVAEKAGATREGILRNRIQVHDKTSDAVMFSLIPEDFRDDK